MKKLIPFIFISLLYTQFLIAGENEITSAKKGHIIGTIIDASTGRNVEYATIALYQNSTKKLMGGGISDSEGFFRLKDNKPDTYYLVITFMGYKTINIPNIVVTAETKELNIGEIKLSPNSKELEDINVVADQASVSYKIDKKVVNVGQQLTAASGNAVDILENVPSVKVDIDGNVSLRGSSSFTVLIDGRPTVLEPSDALSQIPAGAIENIEIITNPSAKYEPDGTSGIINVVTKKNQLNGISGIVNANAGSFGNYSADATIDYRNKKWHVYFGADYRQRVRPGSMEFERQTILDDNTTDFLNANEIRYLKANGSHEFIRGGGSIRGGVDYNITDRDVFGITARTGIRNMERNAELSYSDFINNGPDSAYNTNQIFNWEGNFYSLTLNYKHTFESNKDHFLEVQATADRRIMDESSVTETDTLGNVYDGKRTTEKGPNSGYRFQIDYSLPLSWGAKFETGFQTRISESKDQNEIYEFDSDLNDYIFQDTGSYSTNYTRNTYATYAIYGGEWGNFGYQAGLRMEYTYRFLELVDNNETYAIDRPDFFPTLHFSYKLSAQQELMVSYTRRIERPRGWYLEPFYTWLDGNNIRRGNPGLNPEYVNSFDLGYQKKFKKNFVALEGYYRITENKIERVRSTYEDNKNVTLQTFDNVGTDYALGLEFIFNYSPTKWYTVNLMADLFDYRLKGELQDSVIDQHDFSWTTRMNNNFKISTNTRFQFDLRYSSPQVQAQGTRDARYSANAALKQDFFKRKLSATLQVRDIFATSKRGSTTTTSNYIETSLHTPDAPTIMLSLSYKINNYRNKRNGGNGNGDMDDGGEF